MIIMACHVCEMHTTASFPRHCWPSYIQLKGQWRTFSRVLGNRDILFAKNSLTPIGRTKCYPFIIRMIDKNEDQAGIAGEIVVR
jgi:hypothetical protein